MSIVRLTATDGTPFEFDDEMPAGSGAMKDVFFSRDKSLVVGWHRKNPGPAAMERLRAITGVYRERIFNQEGGAYWANLFCWPTHIIESHGLVGIVMPAYKKHFFFEHGSQNDDRLGLRGKEKAGKWFASALHQQRHLDPRERGPWINYLGLGVKVARAVRRLHMAGLAHSDLSYRNVLLDPVGGNACLIDLDSLVVPGKYPPDVAGTPDFIAPEVMAGLHLPRGHANKLLPSIETDRHALAVLIYMWLLRRHPLRGRKIHDEDPAKDESLAMGARALFIEHPGDLSNRPDLESVRPGELPFADVSRLPAAVCGPYVAELFRRAFIEGLHNPGERPTADDFERALVKTIDLALPCPGPDCGQKWFVYDNTFRPRCPFCGAAYRDPIPVLDLYSSRDGKKFLPDGHRLVVHPNQRVYPWHVNRHIFPNEKLNEHQRQPMAYFALQNGKWLLVNQSIAGLKDADNGKNLPPGETVELRNEMKLLFDQSEGGRLVHIQLANVG